MLLKMALLGHHPSWKLRSKRNLRYNSLQHLNPRKFIQTLTESFLTKRDLSTSVSIKTIFNCSLERAFKTPMLCDVSKVHTGFGLMPKVTHCTDDKQWGKPGNSKKVFVAKSLTQKGGWASVDKIIERIENNYWKIEVSDFKSWMLGFSKFVGEWKTTEIENNKILIEYSYTLHSDLAALYPINWIFTKTFWKVYMKRVLENVRHLAYSDEPYAHD
jgi:hypothetical protein